MTIGTGSRIPPPEGWFRISFWGHISAPNQDIFTKSVGCVDDGLAQCVEYSKYVSFRKSNMADGGHIPHIYKIPAVSFDIVN